MRHLQFIQSNTFRWASVVAGVFAAFIIALFGFIYWQIDGYLVARSDRMIATQIGYIGSLPQPRLLEAIQDHLRQDSRGVQFAGLFAADGHRIAGNMERLPPGLDINVPVQTARIARMDQPDRGDQVVRAIGRLMQNGEVSVMHQNFLRRLR